MYCLVVLAIGPVAAHAQPLTLQGAIETALEANPEVRRSREQVSEFGLRVRSARAEALPKIDLVGSLQQTRDPGLRNSQFFSRLPVSGPVPPGALDAFQIGTYFYQVEVEQPLYQFGRVRHALEAARQELSGVETDVRAVENRVALDVARAYYDLLLARARLSVLAAEKATRDRQLQQVRDRLEIGEATRLDLLQAEVALANLGPEILAAENAIRVALTTLNETLGRAPLEPFEPAEALARPAGRLDMPDSTRLLALATERRPELRRYRLTRLVLEEAEGVTRADVMPDISARASLGINSFQLDNLARPSFHNWAIGVNVRWTLFDGQRTQATIGQLRSQRRQSELDEEVFRARLARDIERASGDWRHALQASEAAALAVEHAREAQRVADELFEVGAATFLDVLDAERALRQAELARLQAYHGALTSLAEIKALIGVRADASDTVLVSAVPADVTPVYSDITFSLLPAGPTVSPSP